VSAIEVDDRLEGQRALARVALAVGLISTTCDSAPTSCLQPHSLSSQHDLAEVEFKSKKASFVFSKVPWKSCPCPSYPQSYARLGVAKISHKPCQQNVFHSVSLLRLTVLVAIPTISRSISLSHT
jgi:hypothetical protein